MKRVLLFVSIVFVGLFLENRLNKSSDEQVVQATVTSVERIKNKRKGDKPFLYRVSVRYENNFGRSLKSSFITRRLPSFNKGETINVSYPLSNPSSVSYQRNKAYRL